MAANARRHRIDLFLTGCGHTDRCPHISRSRYLNIVASALKPASQKRRLARGKGCIFAQLLQKVSFLTGVLIGRLM
jgi:hypothetical protein